MPPNNGRIFLKSQRSDLRNPTAQKGQRGIASRKVAVGEPVDNQSKIAILN